ncbi:uncharacterized protein OCT59_003761 [Rhizophagus irregularis]|uniref:Ste7p n=3 Tax=Rhizophagus irregularis TaxID=588596 RepID=A0A015LNG1_RHIIW|nr:Ste7p [Rhizophagus irregularis DAOM 197198w]UZO12213.1 hypothetical protein OCT59_003761 [Rhizophagus irregularis]
MFSQNIPLSKDNILEYLETNFTNWTSGNEKINSFIQEMQLKISHYDDNDMVLEWIPYNQFNEIKETGKHGLITVYSAIWRDGPLYKKYNHSGYIRDSNKKVALKCLYNSQESIDSLINEAKKYPTKYKAFQVLYGITQNPDTGDYILVQNYTANWISGNEKIDDFIQERQLKINDYDYYKDIVLEWIPYNQFNEIKETSNNGLITVYSAIWKDGPLHKKYSHSDYIRDSNKKVALKCLYNSQESIDSLINEAKKYSSKYQTFQVLYGISQNPDTGDYILVQNSAINSANQISGNEKIDNFIQERQLKINNYNDIVLEYIPYNQFNEIKETGKNSLITVYSAIWNDGPLYKKYSHSDYIRDSNKKVALKCLYNSQESIDSLINEAKKYLTEYKAFQLLYGISQNPDTGDYILVQNYAANWISGNEKIDDFIQERQLKIKHYNDIVLEYIPYNQFNEIKETSNNGLITVYSAIWKDGPLYKNFGFEDYTRDSNNKVALKCFHNSQEFIDSLKIETEQYPTNYEAFQVLHGISQNPVTGDYILVQNNFISLVNWISGNEKIDYFIKERQLKIDNYNNIVLEYIPYNQFNEIKETGKNGLITVYSAIWKDGPICKEYNRWSNYTRDSNKKIALKCFHNTQGSIDTLINEAKKYSINTNNKVFLYGISQNPDTGDYILVQNNFINLVNWVSGNEKIDYFIQESYNYIVLEWIPYNQFYEIKKTGKSGLITVYSAIWKDGPLYKNYSSEDYTRDSNKKVALKCLHNTQESIDLLINEAKKHLTKYKKSQVLYGISRNPDTEDYIFILTWTSGNEKIDDFIQERPLKIIDDDDIGNIMLEWIPYNQFNEIKETGKNGLITVHSATWKDGPLYKKNSLNNYTRDSNKDVALKCLHNSQESIDFLINKAGKYLTKYRESQVLYGISQNPDTEDYILVFNWSSGNEIIDDFIQERQLKINDNNDVVFKWISYSQFNDIKEIGKGGFSTVYSAIWKDAPLDKKVHNRNGVIALKCLHSSQNITDKFLNEVKEYSINKSSNILNIYGISQNPNTKEYIMVLQYAKEGNFNHWMNKNYKYFNWKDKLSALLNIINGLKEIHQKNLVHRDFHTGNILFLNFIDNFNNCVSISDMGLCGEVGNIDETKIYGVMPYVAPEVLRGNHYTQADSFGMVMYFVATGRQPFGNRAHDYDLALDICKGIGPEISEPEVPRCYIDLMKKCWDLDKNNRPDVFGLDKEITSFLVSYTMDLAILGEIKIQFEEAEEYRKANISSTENYQIVTHPQAIYTSRLLNPITKDLPKNDDGYNSQCLDDCALPISFK